MNLDPSFKVNFSQDLMQLRYELNIIFIRSRIQKLISIGDYYNADILKEKADEMEKVEMSKAAIESEVDINKERNKLISNHEKTLQALLRRVERDRREQLKHRQFDTQRLIQRNKNLIKDIFNRQAQEKRKTKKFLQWALSDIN